jgi:hypothetical protein
MASPASPTMTSDIHKPLRDDVRLLGELLGNTLKAKTSSGWRMRWAA